MRERPASAERKRTCRSDRRGGPTASPFKIAVITTGGTIAKTYDQRQAVLRNVEPIVVRLVRSLRLEGAQVSFQNLMHKDSLELNDDDRARIVKAVLAVARKNDAVVVVHGTDTLARTGEALLARAPTPPVPIILTGAMVPFVVHGSDGLQNVTEALFACRLLPPGVYAVFHGCAHAFPGVVKDRDALTFVPVSNSADRDDSS
jgi:L-asparaginase